MVTAALVLLAVASGVSAVSTACGVNMVFTVRRSSEVLARPRVAAIYLAGSAVGSILTGCALGLLGAAGGALLDLPSDRQSVVVVALLLSSLLLGLRDLRVLRIPLPESASQVNYAALASRSVEMRLFAFALWLGVGFLTYSPYSGLYLLALAALLQGDAVGAAIIFAAFGIARGITVLALGFAPKTLEQVVSLADRVVERSWAARVLSAGGLAVVAATLAVALLRA